MYDVAIIGGGPVGVIAANMCGTYGLSAIVLESSEEVYDLPRAVGMWDDVQRILDGVGLLQSSLPYMSSTVGAEFTDASGKHLIGISYPPDLITPNGHPPMRMFHQPSMERACRKHLDDHQEVELKILHEVIEFAEHDGHVSVLAKDLAKDKTVQIKARWVIGCDGANSLVRRTCGIEWQNLGYDREWLVVDATIKVKDELPPCAQQVCDPQRPTTTMPLPHSMRRWEFQLRPGESAEEMEDPERVWSLVEAWVPRSDAEIVRAVVYCFHSTVAETFGHGRVFIAGDAAHQTPPFLAQGLCSGVRDVENLVWKMAQVARGQADNKLLETYTEERLPLATAAIDHSVQIGKLIDAYTEMARGGPEPPTELQEYAYGGRPLPHLSTGLLASPSSEWTGQLVPQTKCVANGQEGMLDEMVGPKWSVISAGDPKESLESEAREFWEGLGAVFVSVPEPEGAILGLLLEHQVVLARPDRIIYGTGDQRPEF